MRIFVTGGTGFVGSRFQQLLTARRIETVIYDLLAPRSDRSVEYTRGDVRDQKKLTAAMSGCDAVLHLAAAHHDFGIAPQTFHDVNVQGMHNVCAAMQANGINDLCFYSTVAVYGDQPAPIDEATTPAPISEYGKTKWAAELVCQKWVADNLKAHCLVIRPTVIFGPEHFANMYALIRQIDRRRFVRVGNMQNIKSLAYIDNIVNATIELWIDRPANAPRYQCLNYVDKPDLTSRQIMDAVYQGLGRKPGVLFVPYSLARLLAVPFDIVIGLTGKNLPISSARIKKLTVAHTQYEADKIHKLVNPPQVPLVKGIENMVQWYLGEGKQAVPLNRRPPANCQIS